LTELKDALMTGEISYSVYTKRTQPLMKRIRELEVEIDKATSDTESRQHRQKVSAAFDQLRRASSIERYRSRLG